MSVVVKTEDLRKSLLNERDNFAPWDNGRRKKVDIVLETISMNEKDAELNVLQESIPKITNRKKDYRELEDSAVKMLRIHYLRLGRTDKEKNEYQRRRQRAMQKIEEYEKKHNINL